MNTRGPRHCTGEVALGGLIDERMFVAGADRRDIHSAGRLVSIHRSARFAFNGRWQTSLTAPIERLNYIGHYAFELGSSDCRFSTTYGGPGSSLHLDFAWCKDVLGKRLNDRWTFGKRYI